MIIASNQQLTIGKIYRPKLSQDGHHVEMPLMVMGPATRQEWLDDDEIGPDGKPGPGSEQITMVNANPGAWTFWRISID